eukprot:448566-Pelagomonas_calceolata.AAC.2
MQFTFCTDCSAARAHQMQFTIPTGRFAARARQVGGGGGGGGARACKERGRGIGGGDISLMQQKMQEEKEGHVRTVKRWQQSTG